MEREGNQGMGDGRWNTKKKEMSSVVSLCGSVGTGAKDGSG